LSTPTWRRKITFPSIKISKGDVNGVWYRIGAPLAAVMFSWTHLEVVEYMATAQAIMSLLAFLTYISFIVFRLDKLWVVSSINIRKEIICKVILDSISA
jgi:hypothetical protein